MLATRKQQEKLWLIIKNSESKTFQKYWEEKPNNWGIAISKIPINIMSQIIGIIEHKKVKEYKRIIKYFNKITK